MRRLQNAIFFIKRLFFNRQGFGTLPISTAVSCLSAALLRMPDAIAGAFDVGCLQRPLVAATWFFFVNFCVCTVVQTDWPVAQVDLPRRLSQ